MGCGESKQAVATENTLTKSKNKSKDKNLENNPPTNDDGNVKNNGNEDVNESENIPEKSEEANENPSKKEDETEKEVVDHENRKSKVEEKVNEAVVFVEENINGDREKYEEMEGREKEKLIIPNESPNKDDDHKETIESIISEGISGKSDYYSPRSRGHVSDGNDAEEKDVAAQMSKEKEEVLTGGEDKSLATPADETKSSGDEKIYEVESETANAV